MRETRLVRIPSQFSKEEFVRKVWITLYAEDAPLDIFESDFGEVSINEHQVYIESVTANVSYQASIGYDRQEPYIDTEKYYEKEPYTATETYYDYSTRTHKERQVTKYRSVQKERQVTRYKTVTDWTLTSGKRESYSVVAVENFSDEYLHEELFSDSLISMPDDLELLEEGSTAVSAGAEREANSKHLSNYSMKIALSLPGDRYKDLDCNIDSITESSSTVYACSEYELTICYKGKTYKKRAFPFGNMKIGGDQIKNEFSLEAFQRQKYDELKESKEKQIKSIPDKIWKASKPAMLGALGLLALSILVSLFVRIAALLVIAYVAAVASFVFSRMTLKKNDKKVREEVAHDIKEETERVENEVGSYKNNYLAKKRKCLDDKLKALGCTPASSSELN